MEESQYENACSYSNRQRKAYRNCRRAVKDGFINFRRKGNNTVSAFLELILEILFELYLEMMILIVPKDKRSKKLRLITGIIAIIGIIAVIALFIWGAVLIADYDNMLGIIPIAIAAVISLTQIIAGIVLYIKRH